METKAVVAMCSKLSLTKKEAQHAVKKVRKSNRQYRKEKRFYYCELCNAWHLTSHEYTPNGQESVKLRYFRKWVKLLPKTNHHNSYLSIWDAIRK